MWGMSEVQPVAVDRDVVDFAIIGKWMDEQGLPGGEFEDVRPLGGGTQNIMLRFRRGGRDYVLRRGPKHLRAASNSVINRESRILGALDGTGIRAPRVIAACPDDSVLGASFYLMEPVVGFNPQNELPELHAGDPEVRRQMGLSAVEAIARLGSLDHEALGLSDYGKPEGFLERQVPRWLKELDSYSANAGYPGPEIPGVERVGDWLDRNRPARWRPGILHGDCHLANMMFSFDGPEVVAMVDWEMSTIGDPLLDLGWQIATRPEPGTTGAALVGSLGAVGGLPTPEEMTAHYGRFSDRDLSDVTWYTVLACFKLGIVLEGTHARAFAGKAPKQVGDFLHAITLELFEKAHRLME
ncbi:phosphotransferase family protein [Nocardia otitidiscaviarum]|uniref:Phosphotransferase family protein n=1 Tax=Nocardia otitidiscaviarum TaxID=1823 RepID=A0A516NWH7_9NOCA|nr:phosphotransferase family protein [Nocardia otitidiscaviarum]MCP9620063.1 phosphotransferase family protein [Nocardia otitidiscaviarum]QDP83245.1 phosphotransferase family protein [Nocardia otitidiscaviarum]